MVPRLRVDPKHDPDKRTYDTTKDQMSQQNALQALAFKSPLPRDHSRGDDGQSLCCRNHNIEICSSSERLILPALREAIKYDRHGKEGDGKVNQYNVLGVLSKEYCFWVKWIQCHAPSLHHNLASHFRVDGAEVRVGTCLAESERELLVCIQHLRLEHLIRTYDCVGDVIVIGPDDGGSNRNREIGRSETEVIDSHFLGWRRHFVP